MDPVTIATAVIQLARVAEVLAKAVQQDGGLTDEQKAQVKAAVQSANDAWDQASK